MLIQCNRYIKYIPGACLTGTVILSLILSSGSEKGFTQNREPLIFLGNEKLAPLVYADRGEAKGVVVDIAQALGKKIGRQIEVRAMNWEDAQI